MITDFPMGARANPEVIAKLPVVEIVATTLAG
jgi:hypothetical protein